MNHIKEAYKHITRVLEEPTPEHTGELIEVATLLEKILEDEE